MKAAGYFTDHAGVAVEDEDPDLLEDYDVEPPEVVLKETDGASPRLKAYFESLISGCLHEYALAERCRALGLDPETTVEIPRAEDLAARVEALVGPPGVAERIRVLSREMNREAVSLLVAKEVAAGKFRAFDSRETALDAAIRTGLAILTEGILVAPLEGIAGVRILKNEDGSDCVAVSYAGPIRAAGGTGQALSVLIADVVRRELGIGRYVPSRGEVDRFKEEIPAYKMAQHLQYTPTAQEIELIARGCPVMIDGEATEDGEVGGNRDLPRIETNRLRGGACLVLAEGLILKAPKIQKHVKTLGLDGWDFINEFVNKGKNAAGGVGADGQPPAKPVIEPNPKYMLELVAGRPVFSHPSRAGGWRLRYGRSRTGGLATTSLHPVSMVICDDFLAVGTQMKIERPGKATAVTPCDSIEGPILLLHNGNLVEPTTVAEARALKGAVKRIVDLGEILVPFGEFAENNKTLPQAAYCHEWWEQEAERAGVEERERVPPATAREAAELAERRRIPLHPRYNLFWHDLTPFDVERLAHFVERHGRMEADALVLPDDAETKETLCHLGALHTVRPRTAPGPRADDAPAASAAPAQELVVGRHAYALVRGLGLDAAPDGPLRRARPLDPLPQEGADAETCAYVSRLSGYRVRARGQVRIGSRMGRPEKAAERKMSPPVHVLFPLGTAGGPQRLVAEAAKAGSIDVEVGLRACTKCRDKTPLHACPRCRDDEGRPVHTEPTRQQPGHRIEPQRIDLAALTERARQALDLDRLPETVKGVQGLISARKTPEPLEKGYLRAKHEVFTFKDGTARYDMTDVTLTHFRPREIHTSVTRLVEMGYTHDVKGAPLDHEDQVLELFPQDVVVPTGCLDYFLRVASYVDEELVRFYGFKPYYNCERREDLVGRMFVGLAPHTSGGVLCRVIGHTSAQAGFGHPFFHAAKRRNCFRGDTEILVFEAGVLRKVRLDALVEGGLRDPRPLDVHGTVAAEATPGTEVLSLDPDTFAPRRLPVTRLIRGSTDEWIEIETSTHRRLVVTPDHRVLVRRGGRTVDVAAAEVAAGDQMPVGMSLPREPRVPDFHLPALLSVLPEASALRLRRAEGWLRGIDGRIGRARMAAVTGASAAVARAPARWFRSFPLAHLAALVRAGDARWEDVPHEASVAFTKDHCEIPAFIRATPALCRLVGFFLAEGHARSSSSAHQLSWRVSEPELRDDLIMSIRQVFAREPSVAEHGTKVTLSSRVVHALFTRLWRTGSGARDKRLPDWCYGLPEDLVAEVIAGYFDGDGSVLFEPPRLQLYSSNRPLLEDFGTLLQSAGIFARFVPGAPRTPGSFLTRRYEALGREPPEALAPVHGLSLGGVDIKHFAALVSSRHPTKRERLMGLTEFGKDTRVIQLDGRQHSPDEQAHCLFDRVLRVRRSAVSAEPTYCIDVDSGSDDVRTRNVLLGNGLYQIRCDGDEDALMLLLDGLLNFSRSYLPSTRGGLMDAPLTLTLRLDPSEVDKEAHNVDVGWRYPLEFYEATCRHPQPGEVAKLIDTVGGRLGRHAQYEGFGFTHDTKDIAEGPSASAYKTIGDMLTKMMAQLDLGAKIRAVDAPDVAARVIGSHFLPDLMGNLKAFSKQKVRCTKCNAKYRRIPLSGRCHKCGNATLTMTVYEASVKKYLEVSKEVCERYGVNPYVRQRIEHIEDSIHSLFQNDRVKKAKLSDFL